MLPVVSSHSPQIHRALPALPSNLYSWPIREPLQLQTLILFDNMATLFSRSSRALPYITGATIIGAAGATYLATRRPLLLDAAQNAPTTALSMLFIQELEVIKTEQVNHDTKRITFSLPGGQAEVSGVPAGCT